MRFAQYRRREAIPVRHLRWISGLIFAALLSIPSAPTFAQDDARASFRNGARAYQAERYEEALGHFRESYAIRPVAVVLFNIGQTLNALDRPSEAIEAYLQYLSEADEVSEERQAAVQAELESLEQRVGILRVSTNVEGAVVRIGNRELGQTPIVDPIYLDRGRITLTTERPGYEPDAREIVIRAGETHRVEITLEEIPRFGTLAVTANVTGATLSLNDEARGVVPFEDRLRVGSYRLSIEAEDYDGFETNIRITEDERTQIDAELEETYYLGRQPWLWILIGGIIVVGAVTTLALVLRPDTSPLEGSLPGVSALRWEGL